MTTLQTLLGDHQGGHSDLQMDSFITIRSGGTLYGCYRQSLRELWKRFRGLRELYATRRILAIEIEKLEAEPETDEFQRRIDRVHLSSKRLALDEADKVVADTEREFLRFYSQADSLRSALGLEQDRPLDSERRAQLDSEMWEHQLCCMLAVDYMTQGRPAARSIELLQCLPIDQRKRVGLRIATKEDSTALIEWYMGYCPEIPEPRPLNGVDARRLLECCESSLSPKLSPGSSPADAEPVRSPFIENDSGPAKPAHVASA